MRSTQITHNFCATPAQQVEATLKRRIKTPLALTADEGICQFRQIIGKIGRVAASILPHQTADDLPRSLVW